jgi:hypothetical protein
MELSTSSSDNISKQVLCTMATKGGTATSLLSNALSWKMVTLSYHDLSESDNTSGPVILDSKTVIVSIAEHGVCVSN